MLQKTGVSLCLHVSSLVQGLGATSVSRHRSNVELNLPMLIFSVLFQIDQMSPMNLISTNSKTQGHTLDLRRTEDPLFFEGTCTDHVEITEEFPTFSPKSQHFSSLIRLMASSIDQLGVVHAFYHPHEYRAADIAVLRVLASAPAETIGYGASKYKYVTRIAV